MTVESIDAALAEQQARVARLAEQAQGVVAAAGEQLRRRGGETERRNRETAQRERQAVERDVDHRFARERDALAGLLAPLREQPALADWRSAAWSRAAAPGRPPALVRIGAARVPGPAGATGPWELPILTPGLGAGHLVVRAGEAHRADALGVVEGVVLRVLASLPPGHVRFRVHDPVGFGVSLGSFGAFERPRVAHGLPTTDATELHGVLDGLVAHANAVSAQHLRGQHATLLDFLDVAGPGEVPYEVLVLLDYPTEVDPDSVEQLTRLATNAASRGILLVVHEPERGREGTRSTLPGATVVHGDERGGWRSSLLPGASFAPDAAPPQSLVDAVARRVSPPPVPLDFEDVLGGEERWSASSAEALVAPLGRRGMDPVELRFDDDTPHGLVAGDTGSGKSNLLRVAIYGLARRYAPEELQLYLLDFKEGIEFRELAPQPGDPTFLPHARVVSTNSSRAFGVAVLEHLAALTSRRYAELPDNAKKLSELRRRRPREVVPRILLVIDEFHVLFDRGDQLSERAAAALTLLAKQGRAAGIHFLLATQAIGDLGAGNANAARLDGILGAARLRVALRLDDRESQAILKVGNRAAAELHERGVAIVNARQGQEQANVRTKVAFLGDAAALRERREALSRAVGARQAPRVFDGELGAEPGRAQPLRMALRGRAGAPQRTWLGAQLALSTEDPRRHPPFAVDLVPDAHRHVAVVGAGPRSATSVLQWAAIGLGASDRSTAFLLVDLLRDSDTAPAGAASATGAALRALGCEVEQLADHRAGALAELLETRLREDPGRRRAVVVFGFDRLAGMDDPLDPGSGDLYPPTPRSVLEGWLARAGTAGTHLLAWWSTFDALEQSLGAQQSQLGIRVYLEVPDQRLMIATGGQCDEAAEWPLALVYDQALGRDPSHLHLFEPFGSATVPDFLRGDA